MSAKLEDYAARRDVSRSGEPPPRQRRPRGARRFVVQKHDASSLHYDFRLEFGRVLVSWAVPKGPSTDPRERRLAVRTEDHPVDYIDFEGVIPAGEYGAGTVLVWDTGTYTNLRARKGSKSLSMERSLDDGLIEVELHGRKLGGGYALKRMKDASGSEWLLVKMDDDAADARRKPVSSEPDSVLSGRDLEAVRADCSGDDE